MSQPPGSIRGELNNALVGGIRQHGADAVGLVIIGMARLLVGAVTLGALLAGGALIDLTAAHLAGLTGAAALVNWLVMGRSRSNESRQLRN